THGGADRFKARALTGLATALEHCGDQAQARARLSEAYRLFSSVGDATAAERTAASLERLAARAVDADPAVVADHAEGPGS
ncbi:hypothetical protein ACFY0R_43100, partial [Streptomyces sp. NPDC001633]